MTTALVSSSDGPDAPALARDLQSAGLDVTHVSNCTNLLQSVLRYAPDVVVMFHRSPDVAVFESTSAIESATPCPVVLFTTDPDADKIFAAMRSGIHAYVIDGYRPDRLRSVVHLAQARFRQQRQLRDELAAVSQRFAERKLIDRARGILMGATQWREDDAYGALRTAAMQGKQRIGQVAQRVIDAAHYGEAINRAGQLRMLSQRLAKHYALACAGIRADETARLLADSVARVEGNLASLGRQLSRPTYGDLLDAVVASWRQLQAVLGAPAQTRRLGEMDARAEQMLEHADRLAGNLEVAGFAAALRVINVSGRQRMLSQRLAKEALIGALLGQAASTVTAQAMARTRAELTDGLAYLRALPLSNPDIGRELALTLQTWTDFEAATVRIAAPEGQDALAELSETLLAQFERLTDMLERGMHALMF